MIEDFRNGGEAILLDALGAAAFVAQPRGEVGVLLDLEGMTNRPPSRPGKQHPARSRRHARFLLAPGQARELIAELQAAILDAQSVDL